MIQRLQRHPVGRFLHCDGCRREPHHVVSHGGAANEPSAILTGGVGERHQLECSRCGRSTRRHASLADAVGEWGATFAQAALPLRVVHPRRRAA